jgi:hypothetical protein
LLLNTSEAHMANEADCVVTQSDFINQVDDPACSMILSKRNMNLGLSCGFYSCAVAAALLRQLQGKRSITQKEFDAITHGIRRQVLKELPAVVDFFFRLRSNYVASHPAEFPTEGERHYFMTTAIGVFELSAWLAALLSAAATEERANNEPPVSAPPSCDGALQLLPAGAQTEASLIPANPTHGTGVERATAMQPGLVRYCYRPGLVASDTLRETEKFECERHCIAQELPFLAQGLYSFLEYAGELSAITSATAASTDVFLVDVGAHFVCTWTPLVVPDPAPDQSASQTGSVKEEQSTPSAGEAAVRDAASPAPAPVSGPSAAYSTSPSRVQRHFVTFNSLPGFHCSTDHKSAQTSALPALLAAKKAG